MYEKSRASCAVLILVRDEKGGRIGMIKTARPRVFCTILECRDTIPIHHGEVYQVLVIDGSKLKHVDKE